MCTGIGRGHTLGLTELTLLFRLPLPGKLSMQNGSESKICIMQLILRIK
jgi:hypothetical protein